MAVDVDRALPRTLIGLPLSRERRENPRVRGRPLYQRCWCGWHPRAVGRSLAGPTVRRSGCGRFLRHRYCPNRLRSHACIGGALFPSASSAPRLGLRHRGSWCNGCTDGPIRSRTRSGRNRAVDAATIRRSASNRRRDPGAWGGRRLGLRASSASCLASERS